MAKNGIAATETKMPPPVPRQSGRPSSLLDGMNTMQHEEITKAIIGCAFEVINELGSGFLEIPLKNPVLDPFHPCWRYPKRGSKQEKQGFSAESGRFTRRPCAWRFGKGVDGSMSAPLKVYFRGECVSDFCADLFVENVVIVELKAAKAIAPEHQAQIINYLNATGVDVGLLINFGSLKLEYKRFFRAGKTERSGNMDAQDVQDKGPVSS